MKQIARSRASVVIGLLLAAPAVIGCDAGPQTPPDGGPGPGPGPGEKEDLYQSGSRLRARIQTSEGGAVRFLGWEDTKAKQLCAFHAAEDGQMRCVPLAGQSTSIQYLDDACTQPVAVRSCGASDRYVVAEIPGAACTAEDNPYAVYEVGDAMADSPTFGSFSGTCLPWGPAAPGTELRAVSKIPAEMFVSAAVSVEPHGDRLSAQVLRADDGAREILGIRDEGLDVACDPRMDDLGAMRCAPAISALGGGNFFADAACERPLLADIGASPNCPSPRFAEAPSDPAACKKGFHAVEVGKKVSSMNVYQGEPNACGPAAFLPPDWAFYEVGPEVDTGALPVLAVTDAGDGRLRVPRYTGPDGVPLAQAPQFIDSERNEACVPRLFADGKTRCVAEQVPRFNLYSDDACTTPLAAVPKVDACPVPAPKLGFVTAAPADPLCPGPAVVKELREVGQAWSGAIVYSKSSSSACVGLDPAQIHVDLYEVGAAVDPSVLAEVTEDVE